MVVTDRFHCIAVYHHTRWSRIATCIFWIVYFHNGQWMTVMIMTEICIMQNLLTKQHLNRWHHYGSMIWVNANICLPKFSKHSQNSNTTLSKTNEMKGKTNGLNRMSVWLKWSPISVMPILTIDLSHLGWPPPLWYPILFFEWHCFAKFLTEIILTIIIRC